MALKSDKKVIDGDEYELSSMDAMRQMRMYPRLVGVLGPVLEKAQGIASGVTKGEFDGEAIGAVAAIIGEKVSPEELEKVLRDMLYSLRKNGRDASATGGSFGLEMSGQTFTVWKLLQWAMELNFGDFFTGLRNALTEASRKEAAAKAAKALESKA